MIAGLDDHIIPASLNRRNFAKYERPDSITDFREFAGRTNFIIGQSHWEEVAGFILSWLETMAKGPDSMSHFERRRS